MRWGNWIVWLMTAWTGIGLFVVLFFKPLSYVPGQRWPDKGWLALELALVFVPVIAVFIISAIIASKHDADRPSTNIPLDEFLELFDPSEQEDMRQAAAEYREHQPKYETAYNWERITGPLVVIGFLSFIASIVVHSFYPECWPAHAADPKVECDPSEAITFYYPKCGSEFNRYMDRHYPAPDARWVSVCESPWARALLPWGFFAMVGSMMLDKLRSNYSEKEIALSKLMAIDIFFMGKGAIIYQYDPDQDPPERVLIFEDTLEELRQEAAGK